MMQLLQHSITFHSSKSKSSSPATKTGFRQSSSYWLLYSNCWNASFGVTYCTVTYLRGPKLLLGGDELTSKPWWNVVCPGNKFIWITFLSPSEMDSTAWFKIAVLLAIFGHLKTFSLGMKGVLNSIAQGSRPSGY